MNTDEDGPTGGVLIWVFIALLFWLAIGVSCIATVIS